MMKKTVSILLTILLVLGTVAFALTANAEGEPGIVASGYCGAEGDGTNLTWTLDSDGLFTVSGTGAMQNFTTDFAVTWYRLRNSIQSVVLEEGVTTVGAWAFNECRNLTSFTIPSTLREFCDYAFRDCPSIPSLSIPGTVEHIGHGAFVYASFATVTLSYGLKTIGDYAFWSCNCFKTVEIPDSVTRIGDGAFGYNLQLNSITLPEGLKEIGKKAFQHTSIGSVDIPASVTSIDETAFEDCWHLTGIHVEPANTVYYSDDGGSLLQYGADGDRLLCHPGKSPVENYVIPASVTEIGNSAFYRCSALKTLTMPEGLVTIGNKAFNDCDKLTEITIPDSVTTIGDFAFLDCTSLASLSLGGGVATIGTGAFSHCYQIESFEIPDSVTSIGDHAFGGFVRLQAYSVDPDNPAYTAGEDGCLYNKDKTVLVAYPIGKPDTTFDIPDTVTTIAPYAFNSNVLYENSTYGTYPGHLESITVPATVTRIGTGALANNRYGMRYIKILNPNCAIGSDAYVYWIDGMQLPRGFKVYGYAGSTAEASTYDEEIADWYYGEDFFVALCPADDAHATIKAEATDPTCTEPGHAAGWYCEDCGAYLSGEAQLALGHAWGEWEVIKQATVDETGLMRRTCQNDPTHVEEQVIPKLKPNTNVFQEFIEMIKTFFENFAEWIRRLFRW